MTNSTAHSRLLPPPTGQQKAKEEEGKKWKNLTAFSNQFPSVCIRAAHAPTWLASTFQVGGQLKWATVKTGAEHNKDLTFSAVSWCLLDHTNLTLQCYKSGKVLAETMTIPHHSKKPHKLFLGSNLWKLANCHHSAIHRSHTLGVNHMTKVNHSCMCKLTLC